METITEKHFENPEPQKAAPKIVKFVNFSDEDFTYSYNKIPYTFKAGEVKFMSVGIARHFAKHLVNRELLRRGRENDTSAHQKNGAYDNPFFAELFNQCIQDIPASGEMDDIKAEQETIDMNMKAKKEEVKSGVGMHSGMEPKKKESKKIGKSKSKKEEKKEEEEFEELKSDIGED